MSTKRTRSRRVLFTAMQYWKSRQNSTTHLKKKKKKKKSGSVSTMRVVSPFPTIIRHLVPCLAKSRCI
jgi:hypothetical protein